MRDVKAENAMLVRLSVIRLTLFFSLFAALSFSIPDRFQQIRPAEAIRNELIEFYLSLAKWNVCVVYDYPHSGSDGGRRKRRSIVLNAIKSLYSSVSFFSYLTKYAVFVSLEWTFRPNLNNISEDLEISIIHCCNYNKLF